MATTIAKTSIGITANATEAISEMEKVAKKSKMLEQAVKGIPEVGEKAKASLAQVGAAGSAFSVMASDVNILQKAVTGVSTGIASMTVGLQLATKVTTGLKAALLGTGIGALVVGLGYLMQKLQEASESGSKAASKVDPARDFAKEHTSTRSLSFMEGVGLTVRGITGGMTVEETRATADALRGFPSRIAEIGRAIGETGPRVADLAVSLARAGETSEEFVARSRRHRDEMIRTASATVLASEAFRVFSLSVDGAEASLARARTIEFLRREVTEIRSETERLRTPLERTGVELDRIATMLSRTGDFERFRRGLLSIVDVPVSGLEATRARIDTVRESFSRLITESVARADSGRGLIDRLFDGLTRRSMATSFEWPDPTGFIRSMEGIAGDTRSSIERTRDRIAEIGEAWSAAGEMAVFAGEEFDDTAFRRATGGALAELAGRGAPEISAPQAIMEGSAAAVSAINAARRAGSDDPGERAARSLEFVRRSTEASERHGAELVRLLGEGRITL